MSKIDNLDDFLLDLANTIRAKKGTTDKINAQDFSSEIESIETGGGSSVSGYKVKVIDYNGTILKEETLNTGDVFTLPSEPGRIGLIFDGWSSPVPITDGSITVGDSDITIGAMYHTASGVSEFDMNVTADNLTVTLNMDGTKNWGDGSSDTETTHTYSTPGIYCITCDGAVMTNAIWRSLFSQTDYEYNDYCVAVRLSSNITSISDYAFYACQKLSSIVIPNSVTSIGQSAFTMDTAIHSIVIPNSVTSIGKSAFNGGRRYATVIPNSVTSIGKSAFSYNYHESSIVIPNSVTSIDNSAFAGMCNLSSIVIPNSVTSLCDELFAECYNLSSIVIPNSVTSIGEAVFRSCYKMVEYDFSNATQVPVLSGTNVFHGLYEQYEIKVPASLYDEWIAAENWSTYASHIVAV